MCLYMYIYVQISSNEPNYRRVAGSNVDINLFCCVWVVCVCVLCILWEHSICVSGLFSYTYIIYLCMNIQNWFIRVHINKRRYRTHLFIYTYIQQINLGEQKVSVYIYIYIYTTWTWESRKYLFTHTYT